jgi:hypothetical protein
MKTAGYHNKKAFSVVSVMLFSPPFMDSTRLETQAPWWVLLGCHGYGPGDPCNRCGGFYRTGGVQYPASELLRTLLLRDWVNSRFPRLALSFSEWQHRGTVKGNVGAGFRLTVEVRENVPARTSENTYLLGRQVSKGKK